MRDWHSKKKTINTTTTTNLPKNINNQSINNQLLQLAITESLKPQYKPKVNKNPVITHKKGDQLIFISAQPDNIYFHWQVELYLHNFTKFIPKERCYAIFGYENKPSEYIKNLKKKYPNIYWYKDNRKERHYVPSIRPNILKQFFKQFPYLGKYVFYHDSDILFQKLPDFKNLLSDDISYLSDTISYIGYNYITGCCRRYKDKYPELKSNDLLVKMADCCNISVDLIKNNENNSGGAQYLLKNIDYDFWNQSEIDQNKLYKIMCDYENKYKIDHHIQKWTSDMWAVLWNIWKRGQHTKVSPDLSFSWATGTVSEYYKHNIFHLAGVNPDMKKTKFYKGEYANSNPIEKLRSNPSFFDYIAKDNATTKYIENMKDYINKND